MPVSAPARHKRKIRPALRGTPAAVLADMVACASVAPEADGGTGVGEREFGAQMADWLRGIGADVRVVPLTPHRPNVIGVFEPVGRVRATVLFAPHLDTVGVAGMTVNPFRLTRKGDRLCGRGACDTKGPAAALLWAFARWARSGAGRTRGIRWIYAATSGEEDGSLGAQELVRAGVIDRAKIDFAVALEPTQLRVVHAAMGILRVRIETAGRAAHGSNPAAGVNAINGMARLLQRLEDDVAPWLAEHPDPTLGAASVNVGLVSGGTGINVVPDRCSAGLDIRHHPTLPSAAILRRLRALLRDRVTSGRLTVQRDLPSFVTARAEPWARALRNCGRGWATARWFCDANIFAGAGVPAVAFGPGDIAQAHTADEYIRATELEAGARAFRRFLEDGAPLA